jgi:hypothetical protein
MWLWRQRRLGYGQGGREEDASKGVGRGLEASEDSGTAVDASKVLKKNMLNNFADRSDRSSHRHEENEPRVRFSY